MRFEVVKTVEQRVAEAKTYLAETDWYYARQVETGEEPPQAVVEQRIVARNYLREQGL